MANREVSLFLKYPGPSHALQRLQHSILECVVEHKSGTESELLTKSPAQLKSDYQLKGTASLVDDEIIVQFAPKHTGLHTVRFFSDTRELCRPIAVLVNRNFEVETTPIDLPVKSSTLSQLLQNHSTPPQETNQQPSFPQGGGYPPSRSQSAVPPDSYSPQHYPQAEPAAVKQFQPPADYGYIRGFTSDPALTQRESRPQSQYYNAGPPLPAGRTAAGGGGGPAAAQRYSYVSSGGGGTRPVSMSPEEATFAGDLFTSRPEKTTFDHLHNTKEVYGVKRNPFSLEHDDVLTADRFRMLQREVDLAVRGKSTKSKKRCAICSKKTKASKSVHLGEEDFCEPCFRRQYLLRSAIEHFMVPTIQECTVDVPVNKKATKFVSTRKIIANANLRGLEPMDVRYAQEEFRKFDMENNGWVNKAVLLPLLKACLTYSTNEKQIKMLLSSQALESVMKSYGLEEREEVHMIEFLCLLAFVARERQRLIGTRGRHSNHAAAKFTASDLEMAYAFRNQFNRVQPAAQQQQQQPAVNPLHKGPITRTSHYSSPMSSPEHQQDRNSYMSPPPQQHTQSVYVPRSPTDVAMNEKIPMGNFSPSTSMQFASPGINRSNTVPGNPLFASPTTHNRDGLMGEAYPGNPPPQRFSPNPLQQRVRGGGGISSRPQSQYDFKQLQQPSRPTPQAAAGFQNDNRRQQHQPLTTGNTSAFTDTGLMSGGIGELPEADQDMEETELPQIPPSKDPSGQTITNTALTRGKTKSSPKQMMEELKLTGGTADSWMLY